MGKIDQYIKSNTIVSIPEIQKRFHLDYRFTHRMFMRLVEAGRLKNVGGINFSYIKYEEDPLFIYTLWFCINEDKIDSRFLENKLSIDASQVDEILSWMRSKEYLTSNPFNFKLLSKEKFMELYGPLDWNKTDENAFDTWTIDASDDFQRMVENIEARHYTFEEYYTVLKKIIYKNRQAKKEEFIQTIENLSQVHSDDKKMLGILKEIKEEVIPLDERRFSFYKLQLVFSNGGKRKK